MDNIAARLARLGLVLPRPSSPSANYLPWHRTGNLLFIAGQVPKDANGQEPFIGKLGAEMDLSQGQAAAQLCALNLLAHLDTAIGGDISRVCHCVRLNGFVNAATDFGQHPAVINGASDLMVAVFGDIGRHTRVAVGVCSLPRNVAVEIDAVFEIR
jgi:enamine deaminase RidA (YjgF/YER057c/UK114 family)